MHDYENILLLGEERRSNGAATADAQAAGSYSREVQFI
jgi:hypothetical protein